MLPAEKIYLPFESGPYRMTMGLTACSPRDLIDIDERYVDELAQRRRLLASRHTDVFAALPGSEAARAEVLATIAALLPERFPEYFERSGPRLLNRLTGERVNVVAPDRDPLETAGRLVQEDLCLVQPGPAGPLLVAAVLCFPTRWSLSEKIGLPLAAVHAHVPIYAEKLASPVDRLMDQLRTGKLVERVNWSVIDDAMLFQPGGKWRSHETPEIDAANAGTKLVLRVERQTLSRLPLTGMLLFTIRVHVYPLSRIAALPQAAARLGAAIRALPPEIAHYKSLMPFRSAVLGYLDKESLKPAANPGSLPLSATN